MRFSIELIRELSNAAQLSSYLHKMGDKSSMISNSRRGLPPSQARAVEIRKLQIPLSQKLMLFVMNSFTGPNPTVHLLIETLAEAMGLQRRQATRIAKDLCQSGLVLVRRTGGASFYTLNLMPLSTVTEQEGELKVDRPNQSAISLLTNSHLSDSVHEFNYDALHSPDLIVKNIERTGFRDKFPANYRAADGHNVRSKAEMLIDNWLYTNSIAHAYEKKVPIPEDLYCDFYIPEGRVYIEYWGLEDDPAYLTRKKTKQGLYQKYELKLIELIDIDIQRLDDILPGQLLKFNVKIA